MKFSHSLIEKLVKPKSKSDLIESLTMGVFEAEPVSATVFNAEIPHNRYADSASHLGVAREYAAITGRKLTEPKVARVFYGDRETAGDLSVEIKDTKLCTRYGGAYFELNKKVTTPAWMKSILKDCGLRPIHPVVDILNYVMLEVGQPLHAFDADKLSGGIVVRRAAAGESITTIDNQRFKLTRDMLVIADKKKAQAIAGIKGGRPSEVDGKTRRILVEAAHFEASSIYRTSRTLGLVTDASTRFAHGMSPHSVEMGLGRARALLEEIVGAKFIGAADVYPKPQGRELIGFSIEKCVRIAGTPLKRSEIEASLKRLGFKILPPKTKKDDFLVDVPPLRLDVTMFEDLVEEVVRLHGMDTLTPIAPVISISRAQEDDIIVLKENIRSTLAGTGFSEVYNYSFTDEVSNTAYELENPIAENKKYLRQHLAPLLLKNLTDNSRFFEDIRIFEIGNVFDKKKGEQTFLGIAAKHASEDPFLELKGVVEVVLGQAGLVTFTLVPKGVDLEVKSNGRIIGAISIAGENTAVAELDISALQKLITGEYEYREIPRFPAVMRDVSLEFDSVTRVGEVLNAIEAAKAAHVRDVDLVDYYDARRFTFRIVFQSNERTLKDREVEQELAKITDKLKQKFKLQIR